MTKQSDLTALLIDIQAQIHTKGVAEVKARKPALLHRSLYKVFKRCGWKMKLAHDKGHVFIWRSAR